MMKDLIINQHPVVEENMSNLTSASGEASVSSSNRGENGIYTQHSFDSLNQTPLQKKKRSLPGNPDPDAEVIALSPRSLMATNRFVCEVCNKGFQRDQNLQLHKRGHNLPWKLKQRTSKEVRKKVYVCPEVSCVHHEASRALGDLTGIKKHFCRKHGEKRWKCDKCSKRYAVQSDWKAHSKTCGTREYRCDCGTLFSRRDSFITHRAFCDALAEETAKAITIANPLLSSQPTTSSTHLNIHPHFNGHDLQTISLKKEEHFNLRPEIPPWLSCPSIFSSRLDQEFSHTQDSFHHENHNPNPNPNPNTSHVLPLYTSMASPHMSATALLQKAAQMGATMSKPSILKPHNDHMFSDTGFDLGLSSCQDKKSGFVHGLTTFGNKAAISSGFMDHISETVNAETEASSHLQNIMNSLSSDNDFDASSFEDVFHGVLNSKRDENPNENLLNTTKAHLSRNDEGSRGGGNDGMTRDFLGLRAFSHTDILKFAGFDQQYQPQNQKPWQG